MARQGVEGAAWLELRSQFDGSGIAAYAAAPRTVAKGSVVVLQEVFGVTEHIREMVLYFAEQGYHAIAPSLFDRVEPRYSRRNDDAGLRRGLELVASTPLEQATGDVQAAINRLPAGSVHVAGFCYGGALAWLAACRCDGLSSASGFYGRKIIEMLDETPRVPIMLHYGEFDPLIPASDVERVRRSHPNAAIFVYPAGHGFCRPGAKGYDAASCAGALARTLAFFDAASAD